MKEITIAAAPRIVQPTKDGISKLTGYLTANSALATLLVIIGAFAICVCAFLLILRKFWPNSPIGQQLQGNGTMVWCAAGMLVGLMLILPSQILPFVGAILATLLQLLLDILAAVFHL
ncbi:hypothetical protein [Bifidobacterium sp. SO1]|uniref:hypothetical protein n=1 Tax=Bifidobacterium sp. SO1 TaxID=2809029 RepID=UPI001BDCA8BD|nr:hypothetical protein [Bifidobacterium sp. SO1]MBT1161771.1 hypothetical protein [Bifidobacterium sp. SO1]